MNCFLNKRIWETKCYSFSYNPTKKILSRDNDQKKTYTRNKVQFQNLFSIFMHKIEIFSSTTSVFNRSTMAYNTTDSLEKLTCTNYVDCGNLQDILRQFSVFKKDSNYLEVKLRVSQKVANKDFRLVLNLTIVEADII